MKIHKTTILSLFLFSALSSLPFNVIAAKSATAQEVVSRTATSVQKARNLKVSFALKVDNTNSSGSLEMSGDKFHLSLPKAQMWYDGRTLWALDASTREVNVSEPTPDELAQINPLVIIATLHRATTPTMVKQDAASYTVRLTPLKGQRLSFSTAQLTVNGKDYMPSLVTLTLPSKQTVTLTVKSIEKVKNLPASNFVFNKKSFPGVTVVDLR